MKENPRLSIDQKLAAAISRAINCQVSDISADSGIDKTPGWDSFGHLRVVLELEAEYSVRFEMNKIPDLVTVELITQELTSLGAL